jgi:CarD family transcriptional regulator
MIPKDKISKIDIRPVADLAKVKKVAAAFQQHEAGETLPWKQRQKANTRKLESGKLSAIAEVIYDLLCLQEEGKLNSSEKRMLNQAKEFLMSELKLVEGMDKTKKDKFVSSLKYDDKTVA